MAEQTRLLTDAGSVAWTPAARESDTSLAAAASMVPRAGTLRERVYKALLRRPMTDDEIGAELELGGNTVRPRRGELVKTGRVVDSGERRTTASGRAATVWTALAPPNDGGPT